MTSVDFTFQERHIGILQQLLASTRDVERAAYVLFGESRIARDPWSLSSRRRFCSREVVSIPSDEIVSASRKHITWSTHSFVRLLKRAHDEGLVAGIVHTHPTGPSEFSEQDDANERDLVALARNRNGEATSLASVLLSNLSGIRARIWQDSSQPIEAGIIRSVGGRLSTLWDTTETMASEAFGRQRRIFGEGLNEQLRAIRVGIVGCGGTGSATAMLLARLGVGQLALFDEDRVDETNLNRLHGARRSDADAMRPKVEVVARELTEMGLGVRVVPTRSWVSNPGARDALKSCDLVFGCTDDHDGRLFLNRLAYFYLIPVIDVGLGITVRPGAPPHRDFSGRVTVITPGAPCLMCRGIVDPEVARDESLKRRHPEEFEQRKREAYVRGGGDPAPAVVTFTTSTACLAVDEFLQGLSGFRGDGGWVWQRLRRFDLVQDRRPGASSSKNCSVCGSEQYWGRADVDPFLDRVS